MSSLRRAHANLLCITPILVYVLPERALKTGSYCIMWWCVFGCDVSLIVFARMRPHWRKWVAGVGPRGSLVQLVISLFPLYTHTSAWYSFLAVVSFIP